MKDTTGTDGTFLFTKITSATLPSLVPQTEEISINNGVLQFNLNSSSPLKIELFDIKGNLLKKEMLTKVNSGVYHSDIIKHCLATNILIIKATIDRHEILFSYVTLSNGNYLLNRYGTLVSPFSGRLAQAAASVDTLTITAAGFQTKNVPITSYENQQMNITLDSANASADTGRSAGCGKALSDLKSGTYTINSAGLSREYIIDIPSNYDPNKPYRLIFAMHWYGGSMQAVANDKFYSLKTYADNDKAPCIFIAPNGTGDTRGWDLAHIIR